MREFSKAGPFGISHRGSGVLEDETEPWAGALRVVSSKESLVEEMEELSYTFVFAKVPTLISLVKQAIYWEDEGPQPPCLIL